MSQMYDDRQRAAIADAINENGQTGEEISEAARAGRLDDLDPFEIQAGHAARIAAEERRRVFWEALEAEAQRHPDGPSALMLDLWQTFNQQYEAFRQGVTPSTPPQSFEKWARALDRMLTTLSKLERQLCQKAIAPNGETSADSEAETGDTEAEGGDEPRTDHELRIQLRAEHEREQTLAGNGHRA